LASPILRGFAYLGAYTVFLPSVKDIEQWSPDSAMWTPDESLHRLDRRAWSEIEALLREASTQRELPPNDGP
jgi:hypothetical protein